MGTMQTAAASVQPPSNDNVIVIKLLDDGWADMMVGFEKLKRIIGGEVGVRFQSDEYMNLYTTIYNLCTQKFPNDYTPQLYVKYQEAFDEYIQITVLPSLKEKHGEFLLRELVQRWKNHKLMVKWLSRFFGYLDRFYTSRLSLAPLRQAGWNRFKKLVFDELKETVTRVVTGMVDEERDGQIIGRALLKNVLDMYVELGDGDMTPYEEDFEVAFLKTTTDYYSKKAQNWLLEDTCPEYMIKAEEYLQKEKDRVAHYLHSSTEAKLMEVCQRELLAKHMDQVLRKENSGCKVLLCDDKVNDLSRMYRLFSMINDGLGLPPVSEIFNQHVTEQGESLVQQARDAALNKKNEKKDTVSALQLDLVRKIMELHDKYMAYVTDCFRNHTLFHKALKMSFEVVCNKDVAGCTSAELFASYCDNILRKGGIEKLSDEAIEENLDKVVKLLTYISDKDLFIEFHRKKLGRRLLFDNNSNADLERSMLSRIKQYFGGQFTSKMEGMLNDFGKTREEQGNFEEYIRIFPDLNLGVDLNVTVLTSGHWPAYKTADINLPIEMVNCVMSYKEFYQDKHKNRKLSWIYSLGSCNVVGRFEARNIELIVNTYQAAVLLQFNDSDRLSFSEIMTQLKLSEDDTARVLHSLSCAKYKILNKEPSTKTITPRDVFEFNSKFTDRMRRIKVQLPPSDEKKKVIDDVNKDRRFAIDASLVRIMKCRKIMTHQNLVAECVQQLSRMFKPDIKTIKMRIDELINRDYLEREEDNPNSYRYVA